MDKINTWVQLESGGQYKVIPVHDGSTYVVMQRGDLHLDLMFQPGEKAKFIKLLTTYDGKK